MKQWILTLLACLLVFSCASVVTSQAQAEEVQFEILGKLGGAGNFVDKVALGDPIFDVAGGLELAAMFRFDMGIGIGLNFNWTMTTPLLDDTQLTRALEVRDNEMTIQYPSIGITLRYEVLDLIDLGFWMNYAFGSVKINNRNMNETVAAAYRLDNARLKWDLQTFEMGFMAAFMYKIRKINLDVLVGLQAFFDFGRMVPVDDSLMEARDIHNNELEENTLNTIGFNIVFGVRYDLIFGKKTDVNF